MRYRETSRAYCSVPRCRLAAYSYCRTDSRLFCRSHVGQHYSQGHEVLSYKCDLCGGYGRVHGQYASANPGGRWVRCPKCFGIGFIGEPPKRRRVSQESRPISEADPRPPRREAEASPLARQPAAERESRISRRGTAHRDEEERRVREARHMGREATHKAEENRRAQESALKGRGGRPTQEKQGSKTGAGKGQHWGCKKIQRCLILTCLALLIAGGVVWVYSPYFVDEGEEALPSPTSTPTTPKSLWLQLPCPQHLPLAILPPQFPPQLRCLSLSRSTYNLRLQTERRSSGSTKPRMVRTGRTIATG